MNNSSRFLKELNRAVESAADAGDNVTKEFLESILKDEEGYVTEIESRLDQREQTGV